MYLYLALVLTVAFRNGANGMSRGVGLCVYDGSIVREWLKTGSSTLASSTYEYGF